MRRQLYESHIHMLGRRKMSRFLVEFVQRLELLLPQLFRHSGPQPPAICASGHYEIDRFRATESTGQTDRFSLAALLGDGILWAVPKHRRTVEKRLKRKFGYSEYVWKPLKVKTNLRLCNQCGHDHEVGVLCPHCYNKVRQETQLMQDKIQEQLGLQPVEEDVIVLYDGEKSEQPSEALNGKRIIEMKKPRPMWFSKNLMQKTTQQPANTKEVKPSELG